MLVYPTYDPPKVVPRVYPTLVPWIDLWYLRREGKQMVLHWAIPRGFRCMRIYL